jgi:prepilin-type N-terminal cleavage/methylation domain-containing protein
MNSRSDEPDQNLATVDATSGSKSAGKGSQVRCKRQRCGSHSGFTFMELLVVIAIIAFLCVSAALPVAAQTFDAVNDFSTNSNPNGAWSYRYKPGTTRDGNYYLLAAYGPADGAWSALNPGAWTLLGTGGVPEIGVNQTGSDVSSSTGFVWPRGAMLVQPGNPALVIVSWVSPLAGLLDIAFSFTSVDTNGGNGIAWYVEKNNSSSTLSSGSYPDGGTSRPQALAAISVTPGDQINFIIDPNGDYSYDSTQVTATINAHPAPPTYDVAADFSAVNNPNAPWSYGYSTTLGGPLTLYTNTLNWGGLNVWLYNIASIVPQVHQNPTSNTINNGTVQIGPHGFGLHPGPGGEYSVARLTVPLTGLYHLTGSFFGEDNVGGTTTDVHILTNGVSVLDAEVTGFGLGTGPSFDFQVTLNAGDPVDFAVGYGTDGSFQYDSTGLSAQIVALTPPLILTPPTNYTTLVGQNVTFSVHAAGPAPLRYQWQFNATNLPGATNPTLTLTNLNLWQSGLYRVVVTNSFGQAVSGNARLTVMLPQLQISPANGSVLLWWPTNASGFTLETSSRLGPATAWSTFSGPIYVFGDQHLAAAEAANGLRFFRLRRP